MTAKAYHLEELEIATRPDDARRILPPIEAGHHRVLDVGCGAGQTLIAGGYTSADMACGIDVDRSSLGLGRHINPNIAFVCAKGEALPFRDGYFDLVISRVALPYMHIPHALAECARVSRPGGAIWLVLHPPTMVVRELVGKLARLELKGALGRLLVLANTLAFHISGRQLRVPFGRPRYESCQTNRGMRKALRRAGYDQIELRANRFFVATACRADSLPDATLRV